MVNARKILLPVLCVLAAAAMNAGEAPVSPGALFPGLAVDGITGGTVPATKGKVAIIDFWASWCAPCKASFPVYSRLQDAYAGRGLVIIGVSVDESASAYSSFVAKHAPSFATVHDSRHLLVGAVQVPTMPTSYLVDRSGKVRFIHAGFHGDTTEREIRAEVEQLLAEGPGAP